MTAAAITNWPLGPLSARRIMQPLSSTSKRCHPARWTSRRWILVSTGCPKTMTLSGSSVEKVEICPPGATFPSLPGAETMIRYRVKASESERGGESLWSLLARNVEARKIRIHRRTAVTKLLRAEDEIIGVEADQAGRRIRIGAKRGVILTTGGFEYNEEMKREYVNGYTTSAYV